MYCVNCGAKITDTSARFCCKCGKQIIHNNSEVGQDDNVLTQEKATNEELKQEEKAACDAQIQEWQDDCDSKSQQERPMKEEATNNEHEPCKAEIKHEQHNYRLQVVRAEHRRIINLSKGRLHKYIPELKRALYSYQNGKYWVLFKIGKLRSSEAFGIMYSSYGDIDGERYLGCCVDLYAVDTNHLLSDYLLLLVEKDAYGVHFIADDTIDEIKQTSILFVSACILTILGIVVAILMLFTCSIGDSLAMLILMPSYFVLPALARTLQFKKSLFKISVAMYNRE